MTPMMLQYLEIKEKNKDCIIFYRLGDFYEMFFSDAQIASEILGLTLTGRDCGEENRAPMCGVPYHSCDPYIAKLVKAGYKVAICEQVSDPKESKGLVQREIVKVITPGTITIPDAIEENTNNFIVGILKDGASFGFTAADATTGELYATEFTSDSAKSDMLNEIAKFAPSEIIYNSILEEDKYSLNIITKRYNPFMQLTEDIQYNDAKAFLEEHLKNHLKKDDIAENKLAARSAAMMLKYLAKTQMTELEHINKAEFYESCQYLCLDSVARANLELTKTFREGVKKGSLLSIIDKTKTGMGARMISNWLVQPLVSCRHIQRRLDAVEEFVKKQMLREEMRNALSNISDIERIVSKIEYQTVNARDLLALNESIKNLPDIKNLMSECESGLLVEMFTEFDLLNDIYNLISVSIETKETPFTIREGGIIKEGYDATLDEWRNGRKNGGARLAQLEARERERTGIKNLKVSYNRVFGYYIEVTRSYFDLIPDDYIRKQTLANAERFITEELKEIEDIVLRSTEKIVAREYNLFCEIRENIKSKIQRLQKTAKVIATVDSIASLSEVAVKNNYTKPEVTQTSEIIIKDGRHPVVETMLKNSLFVPNDTTLDCDENMFSIITGPNMAGKSTYMRQIAVIVILAQMGSYVPATYARVGVVDKIFTRIGASDDLSSGQSTFMVEMNEVANIINNATSKSLLIIDEVGRGTSTFDGLSIAWALVEYIADKKKLGARTLFATHYHELTQLEEKLKGVKNYCIIAKKRGDDIVFLRKIVRGGADESYGIEVAKLAGVSDDIIKSAKKILASLESDEPKNKPVKKAENTETSGDVQFNMFEADRSDFIKEISEIDINVLSPIEAMNKLFELKNKAESIM